MPNKTFLTQQVNVHMGKKLYRWLMQKSTDAEMPPSRYIRRMMGIFAYPPKRYIPDRQLEDAGHSRHRHLLFVTHVDRPPYDVVEATTPSFLTRHRWDRCGTDPLMGSMTSLGMRRLAFDPAGPKGS
jgi:hypothetical protein